MDLTAKNKLMLAAAATLGAMVMPANSKAAVVINELYTYGFGSGALYQQDYVELYNNGTAAVSLTGDQLQYGSATGNFGTNTFSLFTLPSATISVGGYYLITGAAGTGTYATVGTTVTGDFAATSLNLAQTAGKIRLTATDGTTVIDLVGYGTSTTDATSATAGGFTGPGFETAKATSPTATLSIARLLGVDTNNNSVDFTQQTPSPTASGASAIPEPASLGLIGLAATTLISRRRK